MVKQQLDSECISFAFQCIVLSAGVRWRPLLELNVESFRSHASLQATSGSLNSRSSCNTASFQPSWPWTLQKEGLKPAVKPDTTWCGQCRAPGNYTEAGIWAYSFEVLCGVSLKDKMAQLHKQEHCNAKRMHSGAKPSAGTGPAHDIWRLLVREHHRTLRTSPWRQLESIFSLDNNCTFMSS